MKRDVKTTTFTESVLALQVKKNQSSCLQMVLRKAIPRNYNLLKVMN